MTTVSDLVEETRRQLHGSLRAEFNKLSAEISAVATSATFTYPLNGIVAGSYVSIDDEIMYVWETTVASKTATVQRGVLGTTAAIHVINSVVEVNPLFPKVRIKKALQDEIASWGPSLFRVGALDLAVTDDDWSQGVNFAASAGWYYVLEVRRPPESDSVTSWPRVRHWEAVRGQSTADFASGNAFFVKEPVTAGSLRVTYAYPFTLDVFTDATVLETTVGLAASMIDIPPLGAMWRLQAPREIGRSFTAQQGEQRNATEVEGGTILRAASGYRALRDIRVAEEANRLRTLYPVRSG